MPITGKLLEPNFDYVVDSQIQRKKRILLEAKSCSALLNCLIQSVFQKKISDNYTCTVITLTLCFSL